MLKNFLQKYRSEIKICSLFFLCFTVLGLFNFVRFATSELALGNPGRYRFYFIMEMTGVYTSLMTVPFIFIALNRLPINRQNLATRIPIHILFSMILGATHTLLMFSSRHLIFWLFDLGKYDYGYLPYRFLMEYSHQAVTYWFWYGGIQAWRLMRKNQKQKLESAQLQEQLSKVKLQALQMQIHPHFLFNTLNMISSAIYDDVAAADKMIANLSDLLRRTLSKTEGYLFLLRHEIGNAKLYLEIMRARFKEKLDVSWQVDHGLMERKVPGFILQPILENAIHHGMEGLKKLEIQITIQKQSENRMAIHVIDNGPGISDKKQGQGIGLANISERLEKLFGADHDFEFGNDSGSGFRVKISIPFTEGE